jgi:LysM domain
MFGERLTPERPFPYHHDKQMYAIPGRPDTPTLPRSDLAGRDRSDRDRVGPWRLRESAAWRVRWVVLAAVAVTLLALGYVRAADPGWPGPASGDGAGRAYQTVTVAPGDTLWTIAASHCPDSDPRQKVGEIEGANGLAGPTIEPGQRLRLPAG